MTPAFRFILIVAVLAIFFALAGCANGVVMTDEEKVSCRDEGCAAFTMTELQTLVGKVFKDGYLKGWVDSNKQGGRNL